MEIKDSRIPLAEGQSIMLCLDSRGTTPQEYIIQSVAGRGGSVICYHAVRVRDGATGTLKEFYPYSAAQEPDTWFYSLGRTPTGQLVPMGGTIRKFSEMCDDYLNTYTLLNQTIAESPDNQVLRNYVQNGEILYGCADDEICQKYPTESDGSVRRYNTTVYIWSTGPVGIGFDQYLNEVRANPTEKANFKLHAIISTITTFVDALCAIHSAGLLHMDIKPDNFLVPFDSSKGINTSCVSLFDISTFYSIRNLPPGIAGTEGFQAPEILRNIKPDHRADIYSIGAMLFYALVVDQSIPDGLYRDCFYPDIDRLVRKSALIRNTNAGVSLISKISNILKTCLAPDREARYGQCSDLLKALEKAEYEAGKIAVSPKLIGQNKQLAVVNVNEQGISSPDIVIQKMLYDHPLYQVLTPGKTQINVLVIGSGTYGQKFIDQCLQAGQMKGYSLSITAISPTPEEDKDSYLQFRPAIHRFVDINGSLAEDPRAYAHLRFISINEACGCTSSDTLAFVRGRDKQENKDIVRDLIQRTVENKHPYDYVFIALGKSPMNQEIAQLYHGTVSKSCPNVHCPVCYISETTPKSTSTKKGSLLYPVYVNVPITPQTINPVLEQMAFNTDLAWSDSLNMDIQKAFAEFRQNEYRYESSLAYALSIPYKLFSIGIIIQNPVRPFRQEDFPDCTLVDTLEQAAAVFQAEVLQRLEEDADAQEKFYTLVHLEHQRWVLSKVCDAWDVPRNKDGQFDLGVCVSDRIVQNKVKQTHPCIVFSTPDNPLGGPKYQKDGRKRWSHTIDPKLDELDKVSLELHQRFTERANAFKATSPLKGEHIRAIEDCLSFNHAPALRAFNQYLFCLKNILNGFESYTRQYDYYQDCFVDALTDFPEEIKAAIKKRLAAVKDEFYYIIEANLHRNYKAIDERLVKRIPFILTYHFHDTLALAFADGKHQNGRNEAAFCNVASATVLSPRKILYLYHYTADTKLDLLTNKLSAALNYLGKRRVHCEVKLVVSFPDSLSEALRNQLTIALEELKKSEASFADYRILDCSSSQDAISMLLPLLTQGNVSLFDGSTPLFDSVLDNATLITALTTGDFPYFEFDWERKVFTKTKSCDYLQYIEDNSSIRIHDMFALMNAEDTRFNLPEFSKDYETLWNIYTGRDMPGYKMNLSIGNWNNLSGLLETYHKNPTALATIYPNASANQPLEDMVFVLPDFTYSTVKMLISKLVSFDAISPDSSVFFYTSENCKVVIKANPNYKQCFQALFARPEILLSFYGIDVVKYLDNDGEKIQFRDSNLKVRDLNLAPGEKDYSKQYLGILRRLEENHFIRNLRHNEQPPYIVSFEYASQRIKKLLTTAGAILEIYTYYQLLNTGYFDDIACGYDFRWQSGDVTNELDIVATKGFRSIMVECKAVQKLSLDHYHKFHSIAEHFGIGTRKILVGNTYTFNQKETGSWQASNQLQQCRGQQLGIVTVSEEDQILDIGNTLIDIFEGRIS